MFYVLCFMFMFMTGGRGGVQMRLSPGLRLRGERWNTFPGPKTGIEGEGEGWDWIGFLGGGGSFVSDGVGVLI